MKFRIIGADRRTADDVAVVVEEPDLAAAERRAHQMGVLVEHIAPLPSPKPKGPLIPHIHLDVHRGELEVRASLGRAGQLLRTAFRTYWGWWRHRIPVAAAHLLLVVVAIALMWPSLTSPEQEALTDTRWGAGIPDPNPTFDSPHMNRMWTLAIQMALAEYLDANTGEPFPLSTNALRMALQGGTHLVPPEPSLYAAEWRLTAVGGGSRPCAFLRFQHPNGRCDARLHAAFRTEWARFGYAQLPADAGTASGVMLIWASVIHKALIQDPDASAPTALPFKILARSAFVYDGLEFYRVELEQVVGPYVLNVSILDDAGDAQYPPRAPSSQIMASFTCNPV